jgi:predicted  nucleic acid-binding Zn-ribbon protein
MKKWILCVCATGLLGASHVRAQSAAANTNQADAINQEIQVLLQEETVLRSESRTLSSQLQNFVSQMGTNNAALAKLHQDWRAAQDKADGLRAELQGQVESSSAYKDLKARRDANEERILQITIRLREVMKERGLSVRDVKSRK